MNGQSVKTDNTAVISSNHIPIYKFMVDNTCQMKITLTIDAPLTRMLIYKGGAYQNTFTTKEINYSFTSSGTYYILVMPNQDGFSLPVVTLTPYTLTLETNCVSYCGSAPAECIVNCSAIPYAQTLENSIL